VREVLRTDGPALAHPAAQTKHSTELSRIATIDSAQGEDWCTCFGFGSVGAHAATSVQGVSEIQAR
jgi:hypothetical protein